MERLICPRKKITDRLLSPPHTDSQKRSITFYLIDLGRNVRNVFVCSIVSGTRTTGIYNVCTRWHCIDSATLDFM